MNFQDQIQQIFGTIDIHELKQISRDADCVYGNRIYIVNNASGNFSLEILEEQNGKLTFQRTIATLLHIR